MPNPRLPSVSKRVIFAALVAVALGGWLALRFSGESAGEAGTLTSSRAQQRAREDPGLAAPDRQLAESDRSTVQDSAAAVGGAGLRSIELQIVDEATGLKLDEVRVHARSLSTANAGTAASETDAGWSLSSNFDTQVVARVASLRVIASGSSPLRCAAPLGKELWITADGYGWACLTLYRDCPERITVALRRTALLEVEVSSAQDYSRVNVLLAKLSPDGSSKLLPQRRMTSNGRVFFSGVAQGAYRIEVTGYPSDSGEPERETREVQLADFEQRREVFVLDPQWGELVIQLTEPCAEQGGTALRRILIESLGPEVRNDDRVRHIEQFDALTDPAVDELAIVSARVRAPIGKTRVTVHPHGTTYEVVVFPNSTARLEQRLPRLYKRRVEFWDERLDRAWFGWVGVSLDGASDAVDEDRLLAQHALDGKTSTVDTWWPAVPFRLELNSPAIEYLGSVAGSVRFASGETLPDGQRIEVPSLEDSWTLEDSESFGIDSASDR